MKKILALICAFFVLSSTVCSAAYTGAEIYDRMEQAMDWLGDNVSPLGGTDSIAADYYVMALKRSGEVFEYNKYASITTSRKPVVARDAQRIIMANTASGGRLDDEFLDTGVGDIHTAADIAGGITAILSGEYEGRDINRLAVSLLEKQDDDGGFDGDVLTTAKSMIALSFLSGNCYIVKGSEMGEKYRYDVNSALLRGVNYLQNNKQPDFGYGSIQNTAYAIMALDAVGVDADNDPGFSRDTQSTLGTLLGAQNDDGSFGNYPDDTAVAVCALVSHLRAMQDNSMFFALRTVDMPYNPNDYIEDLNYSGQGFKVETQTEIEVPLLQPADTETPDATPSAIATAMPQVTEVYTQEHKSAKLMPILIIILSFVVLTAAVVLFVFYMLNVRPTKKYHKKESKDEDD